MTTLHVLGGGPAGLAAAHRAATRGIGVRVHEAADDAGGNCRTLSLGACRFDTGAHRLHAGDPEDARMFRELLGDTLIEVRAPSRIVQNGRNFLFPPSPFDLVRNLPPRLTLRAAWELLTRTPASRAPASFGELARARYGKALAELFLLGYTRKLWGRDPDALSPAVAGGRLRGLGVRALFAEHLLRRRARHLDGAFLYPRDGIGALTRALENELPPGNLLTASRVTRIRHDGTRITAIELNGNAEEPVENVVSTLPLPAFLRALDPPPPEPIRAAAAAITFRNLVLCVLRLKMPRLTENASLYFPGSDIPFTRLYEPKNRSPNLAPPDETCIVMELPCDPDDATWRAPDTAIIASCREALARTHGLTDDLVRDAVVYRIGHAYPVLTRNSKQDVAAMLVWCERFVNLRLAGRNALFRYAHLHDMLRQGRAAADAVLDA